MPGIVPIKPAAIGPKASNSDVSGAVNNIVDAAGKIVQLQLDFLNNSLKVLYNLRLNISPGVS